MQATIPLPKINGLTDYEPYLPLGEGGMGKVFLSKGRQTGLLAVVKIMHEHLLKDPKARQRFDQETDLMRRFRHPNAVGFLQASPPGIEPPFIVMEYVRGITLDDLLNEHGRLHPLRVGKLLAQLCLFLHTAHGNGLLHRDLTPVNVMIVDAGTPRETVKVMDFGLARKIGFYIPTGQLDRASSAIDGGTPDFICPEQIEGKQVDHRGDLYSVGVMLYMMLTGYVPYESLKDPRALLRANVSEPTPRFSHWGVTDVPPVIEGLVLSCLSKSPAGRPESARALIETYQLAIGCKLVDDKAFAISEANTVSTLHERNSYQSRDVIDQFDASMVEPLVIAKLRGFVNDIGGKVVESDAGVIKVKLPRVFEVDLEKSAWNWFRGGDTEEQIDWIPLELHMAKKRVEMRDMVEITVTRPRQSESAQDAKAREDHCELVCRELRAYLMVGR
jgi:eukaryotic-like serine/threonine-protein kinase